MSFKRHLLDEHKIVVYITSRLFLGDYREGVPPDSIPNSEVKPFIADGTVHKSMEE